MDTSHHYHPCHNTLSRILTDRASPVTQGDKPLLLMTLILGERTAEREEEAGEGGGREGETLAQGSLLFGPFPPSPGSFFLLFFLPVSVWL